MAFTCFLRAVPCPFGFGAENNDDADVEVQDSGNDTAHDDEEGGSADSEAKSVECRQPGHRSCTPNQQEHRKQQKKPSAKQQEPDSNIKFDTDPVAWFKANRITSDKDFEQKKTVLQQEARRRLEALKIAKQKLLEFDSDMDEDSLDDEFSDMNSDAHSLCSFASLAQQWLDKSNYQLKAESYLKYAAPAALAVTMVCVFQSYSVWALCRRVGGVVINTNWAVGCFSMGLMAMVFVAITYFSTVFRSKRMLLTSLVGLLFVYAGVVALLALMHAQPTTLDEKLFKAACNRTDKKTDLGSRLCSMMPAIRRDVSEAIPPFMSSVVAVGGCALGLVVLGVWYMFELAHVEKKANKQRRRDRRSKHTIPWDKIKVTAAATASWVASGGAAEHMAGTADAAAAPKATAGVTTKAA